MNYHSFNVRPAMNTDLHYMEYHSVEGFELTENIWRFNAHEDYSEDFEDSADITPKFRLRQPEFKIDEMFNNRDVTLSKLEEFKQDCVPADIRIKERLLRKDVFLDQYLDTHIKGQIIQMNLGEDRRCRFPNMDQIAWLAAADLSSYGEKSREIGEVQGDTHNTHLITEAMLPVYGFDSKQVKFWFDHQKVWRNCLNNEIEEMLMVNRFTRMKMELLGYHSKFWCLSDQAMSSLNILGYLVYSLKIPLRPMTELRVTEV